MTRLDAIAPADADADVDLLAYLEEELERRQSSLQHAVGRVETLRALLLEARRAAAALPAGVALTIGSFMPHGQDDLAAATRRYLVQQAMGDADD